MIDKTNLLGGRHGERQTKDSTNLYKRLLRMLRVAYRNYSLGGCNDLHNGRLGFGTCGC